MAACTRGAVPEEIEELLLPAGSAPLVAGPVAYLMRNHGYHLDSAKVRLMTMQCDQAVGWGRKCTPDAKWAQSTQYDQRGLAVAAAPAIPRRLASTRWQRP
jgi:protein gp37